MFNYFHLTQHLLETKQERESILCLILERIKEKKKENEIFYKKFLFFPLKKEKKKKLPQKKLSKESKAKLNFFLKEK